MSFFYESLSVANLFTWFFIVVGWLVINYQNNRREDRKEQRNLVDEISKDVDDLENKAIDYHFGKFLNNCQSESEHELNLAISRLSLKIGRIKSRRKCHFSSLFGLRSSITLHNFQTSSFSSQSSNSVIVLGVKAASLELKDTLENGYAATYHGHLRSFLLSFLILFSLLSTILILDIATESSEGEHSSSTAKDSIETEYLLCSAPIISPGESRVFFDDSAGA